MSILNYLTQLIPGCVGVSDIGNGAYQVDAEGGKRAATAPEILQATKATRIDAINAECRIRLIARFGDAAEQISRSLGIYGAAEKSAMEAGIAATIDASNTASNAVLAAATIEAVEAVTVTWPAI